MSDREEGGRPRAAAPAGEDLPGPREAELAPRRSRLGGRSTPRGRAAPSSGAAGGILVFTQAKSLFLRRRDPCFYAGGINTGRSY